MSCGTVQPTPREAGPTPHPQRSVWSPKKRNYSLRAWGDLSHSGCRGLQNTHAWSLFSQEKQPSGQLLSGLPATVTHGVMALRMVFLLGEERMTPGGCPVGARPRLGSGCSEPLPWKLFN